MQKGFEKALWYNSLKELISTFTGADELNALDSRIGEFVKKQEALKNVDYYITNTAIGMGTGLILYVWFSEGNLVLKGILASSNRYVWSFEPAQTTAAAM